VRGPESGGDVSHGAEHDSLMGADVFEQTAQHEDPASAANALGVHPEDEDARRNFVVEVVALGPPHVEHVVRRSQTLVVRR
jgi:hypothetical protein